MTALALLNRALADGLRPDTLMTVSQWSDAHRRLPRRSSAEPGPWRTSRTPYLKEIMDNFSANSDIEQVVLMKAAQVGGSEAILNAIGYCIDHAPGPALLVQPTDGLAKRFSRQRLEPLLRSTPRLADKVAPARSRDSGNTLLSKEFPGGILVIAGANSAVGLRSIPAMFAFLDEVDGFPVDVNEEGSPLSLVEARQRTFSRRKRMLVSTPTIAGIGSFDDEKQGEILHKLANLTRKLGVTIIVMDHFRKAGSGKGRQEVTIDDLKGTGGKAQNADCVILMERTANRKQIKFQVFSKDFDDHVRILLNVAPRGSSEPKFTYAGDLDALGARSHEKTAARHKAILEKMTPGEWLSIAQIEKACGVDEKGSKTLRRDLNTMAGKEIDVVGENKARRYCRCAEIIGQNA